MNTRRIILGGLAAGGIIGVGGIILNLLIQKASNAVAWATADGMPVGVFALRCLVLGIGCVLLYALMLPPLGPGPKTALTAGILSFLLGVLFPPFGLTMNGSFPPPVLLLSIIWSAIQLPVAAVVGASLYREDSARTV